MRIYLLVVEGVLLGSYYRAFINLDAAKEYADKILSLNESWYNFTQADVDTTEIYSARSPCGGDSITIKCIQMER